jgi:hypothetical protein
MQSGLSAGDKKWLWGTAVATAVLAFAAAFATPPEEDEGPGIPSSYSTKPGGAMAAYLLLAKLGYPVSRRETSPLDLKNIDPSSVLILAEPTDMALPTERTAIADFVRRGGRVLFCGPSQSAFVPLPDTKSIPRPLDLTTEARLPSGLSRDAKEIRIQRKSEWSKLDPSLRILYGDPANPSIVVSQLGEGQVIWWTSASPLTNKGLRESQNLQLFLNVVSNADGSPKTVYWDEYFHGQQGGLWTYIAKTPLPWGLWQLAFVVLVALFAWSRRSGPIVAPRSIARLSPLEFVDTMGELYRRADATQVAIDVPYRRLRLQLTRRLGEPITISDAALAQVAARRLGLPEAELRATLEEASFASKVSKLDRKKALALVQALMNYGRQLSGSRNPQEKIA